MVIGAGGLGHLAIQILRTLTPARIVVVDTVSDQARQALELGADEALLPTDDAVERVRSATGSLGAELVLDLVGSDDTLALAVALQPGRRPPHGGRNRRRNTALHFFGVPYECSVAHDVLGHGGRAARGPRARPAGRLHVNIERFPLERALEAYERLRAGTIAGRAVITPNDRLRTARRSHHLRAGSRWSVATRGDYSVCSSPAAAPDRTSGPSTSTTRSGPRTLHVVRRRRLAP